VKKYDLVCQLGSQVKFVPTDTGGYYELPEHTDMRTRASVGVINAGIAPLLMVLGGSNFGVRYDDSKVFGPQHPTQKTPVFTFEAFAASDYDRESEAAVIKEVLVTNYRVPSEKIRTETISASTEQNARFCINMLMQRPTYAGVKKVGVLTLLYHMERAFPDFQKTLLRQRIANKVIEEAGLGYDPKDPNRPELYPDLEFFPVYAEDILAMSDNPTSPMPNGNIEQICKYYATPKGGKQYDVDRIRELLVQRRSLANLDHPHRNPFGVDEDDGYFDELFTSAWSVETSQSHHMTNALAWLEQWQKDHPVSKPA